MIGEDDFKQLKMVFYKRYLDHGLVEISIGIFLVSIFLAGITGYSIVLVLIMISWSYICPHFWTKIIEPRFGYVKWSGLGSGKSNKLQRLMLVISVASVVFPIILLIIYLTIGLSYPSDWVIEMHLIIIGIVCLTICSITGFISGLQRFYFYGMGAIVIFNMAHLLNASAVLSFGILGIIFFVIGIYLLIRFLRNHPVLDLEGEDVD